MSDRSPLPDPQEILAFWFGEPGSPEHGQPRPLWFQKSDAVDREIGQRFGARVEQALAGELLDWASTPDGALARVLLLDQFTRNIFRDTPRAFAGDTQGLAAAQAMVATGQDQALPPFQRGFVYLPYEHSESLAMQDEAVRLFTVLAATGAPGAESMLDYAHRHRAVIVHFGRFPHRNDILGRPSSPEELAFLQEPGSRF